MQLHGVTPPGLYSQESPSLPKWLHPACSRWDHHIIFQEGFITTSKQSKNILAWQPTTKKPPGFPGILLFFFSCLGGEGLTAHTTGNKAVFLWSKVPLRFFKHHRCSTGCQWARAPACWFQDWNDVWNHTWASKWSLLAFCELFHYVGWQGSSCGYWSFCWNDKTGGCLVVFERKSLFIFCSFTHSLFCTPKPFTAYKELAKVPLGSQVHGLKPSVCSPSLIFFSPEFGISFMNLLSHTYRIRETSGLLLNSPLHFPVSVGLMKWTVFYGWIIRSSNLGAKREWKNNRLVSEWYWARQILNQFPLYYRYRVIS